MTVASVGRGIFANMGVKLFALVVAVVIWFSAISEQEDERNFIVPLEMANLADTLTVTGRVPDNVEISVRASRRDLLLMEFRKVAVSLNMHRAEPGRFTQRLSVSDVVFPTGIEPFRVRIVSPLMVDVTVEKLATRRSRVAVTLSGALPNDQLLSAVPEAEPDWVLVTGPQSIVGRLDKVPTKSIDLSRVKESGDRDVELDTPKSVASEPEKVKVGIYVSERGARVLTNIPPTVLVDEQSLTVEVVPKTLTLTLEGPKALLDTLSSKDVSILLDLSGKEPGRYSLAPEVIVPNGIVKYSLDTDSVRIFVTRSKTGST
jgi:YbbR domain-containing protein